MTNVVSIAEVSNQKKVALVSRYLQLHQQLADLKQELEQIKVEAIEILGEGEFEITKGKVSIKWVSRPILDQGKAKSFLTPAQLEQCFRKSEFYDIRITHKGV